MNLGAAADFGDGKAERIGPALYRCDDSLLVHDAHDISINATLQMHSCKKPRLSARANLQSMDGLKADTAFVKDLCRWTGLKPSPLAGAAGLAPTTILRPFKGENTTRISQTTLDKLQEAFPDYPGWNSRETTRKDSEPIGAMPSVDALTGMFAGLLVPIRKIEDHRVAARELALSFLDAFPAIQQIDAQSRSGEAAPSNGAEARPE